MIRSMCSDLQAILCGRKAVQVLPQQKAQLEFDELAEKLKSSGKVVHNRYLLRLELTEPDYEVTVFPDGRAIIKGTEDVGIARGIYSRYIGT